MGEIFLESEGILNNINKPLLKRVLLYAGGIRRLEILLQLFIAFHDLKTLEAALLKGAMKNNVQCTPVIRRLTV